MLLSFLRKDTKIRIGVDGGDYCLGTPVKNGIQRLVASTFGQYPSHPQHKERIYYYYFGGAQSTKRKSAGIEQILLPTKLFSSVFLPLRTFWDHIRIYVGFSGVLPPFTRMLRIKSIICIHDLAFIKYPTYYRDPQKMKWQTEYALYGADKIVVFSDYVKNEIYAKYPNILKGKIVRIYPGSDHLKLKQVSKSIRFPFFLYVGVIKPMKNIEKLLTLFDSYVKRSNDSQSKLVLIGNHEPIYFEQLKKTELFIKLKGRLLFKSNLEDTQLVEYYKSARAVLNTSRDEGFCYPVAEALRIGTRVIVNDLPLYFEFQKYYPAITIAKNDDQFLAAMSRAEKPLRPEGDVPFKWSTFKNDLLQVINGLI